MAKSRKKKTIVSCESIEITSDVTGMRLPYTLISTSDGGYIVKPDYGRGADSVKVPDGVLMPF